MSPTVDPLAGASTEDLIHLVRAIQTYRVAALRAGQAIPPGLLAIEHSVSQRAIGGQTGPKVGTASVDRDAGQMDKELFSYTAAAHRLGYSLRTFKRRIAAGDIVPVRDGRMARIRRADLDAFIDQHQGAH